MYNNAVDQLVKAYISRSALLNNIRMIQKAAAGAPVCAMVKGSAYGHDAALVVQALRGAGIAFWGTATLNEALELRALKLREPILVMRPLTLHEPEREIAGQIRLMRRLGIRPTIVNSETFRLIAGTAAPGAGPLCTHVKVDTGMSRNGCPPEELPAILDEARATRGLRIEGIFSHFSCADDRRLDCARKQLARFTSVITGKAGRSIKITHMANSGAIFRMPQARFDMVRPGRAIYGYGLPFADKDSERLAPVMRIEAPLLATRWIKKGSACGYGCTYRMRRATRIGLLPLGYADGYSRRWSNAGAVDFEGRLAPVIGRVSMDLTIIDVTSIPEAQTGSAICVLSNRREAPHSMESMARKLGTIPHEIGCAFGRRIQRVLCD